MDLLFTSARDTILVPSGPILFPDKSTCSSRWLILSKPAIKKASDLPNWQCATLKVVYSIALKVVYSI
jgi:hypothetical protein